MIKSILYVGVQVIGVVLVLALIGLAVMQQLGTGIFNP